MEKLTVIAATFAFIKSSGYFRIASVECFNDEVIRKSSWVIVDWFSNALAKLLQRKTEIIASWAKNCIAKP